MKVVSVCGNDWANFAHNFSESLKAVGVESYSYCLTSHPFGYPKQSTVVSIEQLPTLTEGADFVVVHHSCNELLPYINNKRIIHYAAGSKYRANPEGMNEAFKDCITTFIALPEFQYHLKNFHYIVGAVDTDVEVKPINERLVVAHYPSNPEVKGSAEIIRIVSELQKQYDFDFRYSLDRVSYAEQQKRMSECDIYVELLAPTQGGKPYGSFGMTALEAAAMGKIVLTQEINNKGLYQITYNSLTPFGWSNNSEDIKKGISFLCENKGRLKGLKDLHRDWVIQNHSFKATGERVLNILHGLQGKA
jgi:hypothetical protein